MLIQSDIHRELVMNRHTGVKRFDVPQIPRGLIPPGYDIVSQSCEFDEAKQSFVFTYALGPVAADTASEVADRINTMIAENVNRLADRPHPVVWATPE